MKIAVYGISRSGKDYLIDSLVNLHPDLFYHVKGSAELRRIASEIYGKAFSELREPEQSAVRKEFISTLSQYEKQYSNVLVDGHFAFPEENGYRVVFDSSDFDCYDAVFYLNRSGDTMKKQADKSDRTDYKEFLLQGDNAVNWEQYEIRQMQGIYEKSDKDFIVLDESFQDCLEYIHLYAANGETGKNIADRIATALTSKWSGVKTVMLTDLDKTVSTNDTTYDFLACGGLEKQTVKDIFYGDYYTGYQQFRFHSYLQKARSLSDALEFANRQYQMNTALIQHIIERKPKDARIVGITAGIADLWQMKNAEIGLCDVIVGKSYSGKGVDETVSKKVKGILAKLLKEQGYRVVALGDSVADLSMLLQADEAFLICGGTLNKGMCRFLADNPQAALLQPSFNAEKYDSIEERDRIW